VACSRVNFTFTFTFTFTLDTNKKQEKPGKANEDTFGCVRPERATSGTTTWELHDDYDNDDDNDNYLFTAVGLLSSGSGYFTCIQNMKSVTTVFNFLEPELFFFFNFSTPCT
jgi:hypothetical protein